MCQPDAIKVGGERPPEVYVPRLPERDDALTRAIVAKTVRLIGDATTAVAGLSPLVELVEAARQLPASVEASRSPAPSSSPTKPEKAPAAPAAAAVSVAPVAPAAKPALKQVDRGSLIRALQTYVEEARQISRQGGDKRVKFEWRDRVAVNLGRILGCAFSPDDLRNRERRRAIWISLMRAVEERLGKQEAYRRLPHFLRDADKAEE